MYVLPALWIDEAKSFVFGLPFFFLPPFSYIYVDGDILLAGFFESLGSSRMAKFSLFLLCLGFLFWNVSASLYFYNTSSFCSKTLPINFTFTSRNQPHQHTQILI
jgi:hypothetical protein